MKSSPSSTRLLLLASLALLVAFGASPALAGINRWTPYGPGAGTVQALAVDPVVPGTLYALTGTQLPNANGEIYKSTDFGATWKWASAGLPFHPFTAQSLALDPVHPGTLFTNIGPYVFRSTDGAAHWTAVDLGWDPEDFHGNCALAVTADAVFYAYGPHVLRSLNGGTAWTSVFDASKEIQAFLVNPMAPHALYLGTAAGGGGLWVSTDRGDNFTMMHGMDEVTALGASATGPPGLLYAASAGTIQVSVDGGMLWRPRGAIANPVYALAVDPTTPTTVFAAHAKGISVSRDGGETWRETRGFSAVALSGPPKVLALAADPARPGEFYAGTQSLGVFKSISSGRVWTAETQKGLAAGFNGLPKIHPAVPGTVFLVGDSGYLFRSADSGQSWEKRSTDVGRGFAIGALALDPLSPLVLYAANEASGVYRSGDGGATWSHVGLKTARALVAGNKTLLALSDGGLLRSVNGGKSWSVALADTGYTGFTRSLSGLAADPATATTFYVTATDTHGTRMSTMATAVYRSRDSGATWQRFVANADSVAVAPGHPATLYTVLPGAAANHLLRTTNTGRTWKEVGTIPKDLGGIVVDQLVSTTLYAATPMRGVWRSTDGGITWEAVSVSLARQGKTFLGTLLAHPATPHTFYVVSLTGGLFEAQFTD